MSLKSLVKKGWDGLWGVTETPIDLTNYTRDPKINPAIKFFYNNGEIQWENINGTDTLLKVYRKCAPLSAIINRSAKAFASGNLEVLNATTDNYVRGQYKDWEKLLNNPNPLQSKRQYFRQQYTYTQINGWSLALKVTPVGFNVPTQLWPLPFWCIEVEEKKKRIDLMDREQLLSGMYFTHNGIRTPLDPKNLILFTDDSGDIDDRTWLPRSRFIQLQYPITTLLSAVEAEVTMIQKKGAIGIITNKQVDTLGGSVPMTPDEKDELQAEFRNYGLSRNQWQYIISQTPVEYQSMTFPTKDLLLHESYRKAYQDLCDEYEFPYELTAHSERKNLANVKTFDTILYQNKIIPDANAFDEQLMVGLGAVENNIKIRHDYSHVPALQQSEEEKGKGRKSMNEALKIEWDNNILTRNMWLEKLGEDTVKNDLYNKYKYELSPEELGVIIETPNNSNNGDKDA